MKKTFIISILSLAIFSCESDFLDKQPSSQLSAETFWETEQDAQLALTGLYGNLQQNVLAIRQMANGSNHQTQLGCSYR